MIVRRLSVRKHNANLSEIGELAHVYVCAANWIQGEISALALMINPNQPYWLRSTFKCVSNKRSP